MPTYDYLISARAIRNGEFIVDVGSVRYLRVPDTANIPAPQMATSGQADLARWVKEVRDLADANPNPLSISIAGDLLIFIHGYNNDLDIIIL